MSRLSRAVAVGCLALGIAAPSVAPAETLADALTIAYRHAGLLEKNRALLRAADEDVAGAVAALRPIIDYVAERQQVFTFPNQTPPGVSSPIETDQASVQVTGQLLLWDGGQSRLAIDAAKEAVLATRENLIQVEQQVLGNAAQAYFNVQEAEAFVNLGVSQVGLLEEQLRAANERFEVGEVTRTDVALAESQLASARSNLSASRGDLEIARAQYVQFVGREPGVLAPVTNTPSIPATFEAAQVVARTTHPLIRADMRAITVAELNVKRAEAAIRPNLNARATIGIDQDYTESVTLGATLQGPIYRGGALTSAYRQAVARRDEERADLHVTVDDILQRVASAYAQLRVARAQISAGQEAVRASQIAFDGLQEEAALGARTTLDVLDAEQDLQDARANLISAQIAQRAAVYTVLSSMGLLTVSHLGLGVQQYDPSAYYRAVEDAPIRKVSPQGQKLDRLLRSLGRQ